MPSLGAIKPLNHNSTAPRPPIPLGVFIPPYSPPVVWPGPRSVDLNMLPHGPPGQIFPPNVGTSANPIMYFNQPGPGRGVPLHASGPEFNVMVPVGHGQLDDKGSGGWVPPKSDQPLVKAPSRGEQNDFSQNFVDTGTRPQNFIGELELTYVEDYPKLRELIQKKDEIVA
ncbi:hypothetical protein Nepgr_010809 [Nepenthes gracilis]|uniref:Uncharacterized protein n=1 Tax=Nepenthes gracilis TaxID=150966 RepID=A0AAD3XLP1_NEPGR|nr:hypothetical protein Nepgr_010809 [Nepenthes gracilis]